MGLSMPVAHVSEAWQSAEFYSNKILMQYRASAPEHVEWVKAVKDLVDTSLKQYVKEHHTTGPAWNPKGGDVASRKPSAAGSAPKPAGGPPPPPPPPPPGALTRSPRRRPPAPAPSPRVSQRERRRSRSRPAGGMNAVFKELNKGEAITSGLRKVTDDMKTKNRADRVGLVADARQGPSGSSTAAPAAPAAKPALPRRENGPSNTRWETRAWSSRTSTPNKPSTRTIAWTASSPSRVRRTTSSWTSAKAGACVRRRARHRGDGQLRVRSGAVHGDGAHGDRG